jgi:predicted nucleic acid-binding protein
LPLRYLLDTNTCIGAMRHHTLVLQRMAAVPPADCAISSITSYELFTGVEKCADPVKERAKVDLLLATISEQLSTLNRPPCALTFTLNRPPVKPIIVCL